MADAALLAAAHRRACLITSARNAELRRALVARLLFDLRAGLTSRSAELPAQQMAGRAPHGAQAVEGRHHFDREQR